MPYEVQWERPFGVRVRHYGVLSAADVAELSEIISSDPSFDDLRYCIADTREVVGHAFDLSTPGGLETPFASLIGASHTNPHIHFAVICTNPSIRDVAQVIIERRLLPFETHLFTGEAEAREWLGSLSGSFRRPPLP